MSKYTDQDDCMTRLADLQMENKALLKAVVEITRKFKAEEIRSEYWKERYEQLYISLKHGIPTEGSNSTEP